MGKAYTEEERQAIRQRLFEEALILIHDGEKKSLNVRELTERAGISLGSFYRFYKDKRSLVRDIMEYRANQKLSLLKTTFPKSTEDPKAYVFHILYENSVDMGQKLLKREIYQEIFEEAFGGQEEQMEQFFSIYQRFLEELEAYWKQEQLACQMDVEGIMSLIRGVSFFFDSAKCMKPQYFDELLRLFLQSGVERYVMVLS